MEGITTLELEPGLSVLEAMALAQLVKRISWSDLRGCAVDDAEAYTMADALNKLQIALRDAGYAPR